MPEIGLSGLLRKPACKNNFARGRLKAFSDDLLHDVEINSVIYTFGFCLKTRLSSYPALSRMSIDTEKPLCS